MTQLTENNSIYFIFDGTFEGLLCCVFEAFDKKTMPFTISQYELSDLFANSILISTETLKANRVLKGLKKKISPSALNMLFTCWLSELKEVEILLFNYICKTFLAKKSIELNFADPDVLELSKIYKKVTREAEKVRQFVRFQKTNDQTYFAAIEPLYNVLPLSEDFFEDRFADQQWIVYDLKRKYGLYYNLEKTEIVYFDNLPINKLNGKLHADLLAEDELDFQGSWKQYLQSITIKERKNLKLQRQHMPKRFWKYLTEKQG
jgi:probable DNA metabolism protein